MRCGDQWVRSVVRWCVGAVLMCGGLDSPSRGQPLDLCRSWSAIQPDGYGPMVFDEARNELVLLASFSLCCDLPMTTWTLRGTRWEKLAPASQFGIDPPFHESAVYDAARSVTVAATAASGNQLRFAEWDGTSWRTRTNVLTLPSQGLARLVHDSRRGETLVFVVRSFQLTIGVWDGNALSIRYDQPFDAGDLRCAYDPVRDRTVIYAPRNFSANQSTTYEWDGTSLRTLAVEPREEELDGLFFDPTVGRVRRALQTRLSEWTGEAWTAPETISSPAEGAGGDFNSGAFDPRTGRFVAISRRAS